MEIATHVESTFTLEVSEFELHTMQAALKRYRESLTDEDNCGHSITADVDDLLPHITRALAFAGAARSEVSRLERNTDDQANHFQANGDQRAPGLKRHSQILPLR
jgi:hypothetical protein